MKTWQEIDGVLTADVGVWIVMDEIWIGPITPK